MKTLRLRRDRAEAVDGKSQPDPRPLRLKRVPEPKE
jgi:hypothetical protein